MALRAAVPSRRRRRSSSQVSLKRLRSTACCLTACGWALLGSGCSLVNAYEDPVLVGKWEGAEPFVAGDNSTKDSLVADLDGGGKSTIFFSDGAANYSAKNKLEWEQTDERDFLIRFKCSTTNYPNGCNGLSFYVECEADNAGDDLECKCEDPDDCPYSADTRWQWERD